MSPLLLAMSLLFSLEERCDPSAPLLASEDGVAQEEDAEEDDEFDFLKEGDEAAKARDAERDKENSFEDEEDNEYADFEFTAPAPRSSAPPPTAAGVLPDIIGKDKLQDNYTPLLSSPAPKVVLLELPVLVAHDTGDYDGRAFWVVTQVLADGMPVGSSRNEVRRETLALSGPTFVFVKLQVPVPDQSGELEIRVGVATASGGQPKPLFSRKVPYSTK